MIAVAERRHIFALCLVAANNSAALTGKRTEASQKKASFIEDCLKKMSLTWKFKSLTKSISTTFKYFSHNSIFTVWQFFKDGTSNCSQMSVYSFDMLALCARFCIRCLYKIIKSHSASYALLVCCVVASCVFFFCFYCFMVQ